MLCKDWLAGRVASVLLLALLVAGCQRARVAFLPSPAPLLVVARPAEAPAGGPAVALPARVKLVSPVPRRQNPQLRLNHKKLVSKSFSLKNMLAPAPLPPAKPARPHPNTAEEGGTFGAGLLVIAGGALVALGGVLLGVGLGGAWVLLTSVISLPVGLVVGMYGLFGALSRSNSRRGRFNLLRLLGLVAALGGLGLGWYLGGLAGVGGGLLLLGLGSFLTGVGLILGAEAVEPSRSPPVSK